MIRIAIEMRACPQGPLVSLIRLRVIQLCREHRRRINPEARDDAVLAFVRKALYDNRMSSKELVLELVRRLPDEASMLDIAREIEFVAGVREAMAEFDRGESLTAEELLREIPQWARNSK